MQRPTIRSQWLRTVVALTLAVLPLRPIYGELSAPACGDAGIARTAGAHRQADGSLHRDAVVARDVAPNGTPASCLHSGCPHSGPACDGNCISCTGGAVPAAAPAFAAPLGAAPLPRPAAACTEVILSLPPRPPQAILL